MLISSHCTQLESVRHLTTPLPELSRSDDRVLLEPHLILFEHGLESFIDDLLDKFCK